MAVPIQPADAKTVKRPRGPMAFLAAVLLLLAFGLWSCNTSPDDVYSVTLKLDSARVGKFDSVRVEIYNGQAPKAGDTTKPVQTEVIRVSAATKEVTITLNAKVKKDFSVVVTGFSGNDITYRNLHNVEGFVSPDTSKHSILLITSIKAEDLVLSVGETRLPVLTITPNDAVDKKVKFTVANEGVVAVSNDSLKGVAVGKTKAKAISPDGAISIEFGVTVVAVRVTAVQADSALALKVGDSVAVAVTVAPDNATDKEYALVSFDSLVARTSGHSVVAVKAGDTKIVVASRDGGAADTIALSVRLAVTGLTAKAQTKEVGDKFVPVLEFAPADATNKKYTLSTPDTAVVRVFGDSLEAKSVGTAKVTAVSADGSFPAPFDVTVVKKVFRVKGITAAGLRGLVGDTLVPKLTFDPANASDQGFTLTSLDTAFIGIAGTKVVLKALGTAKVEIATVDGGLKTSFDVAIEISNFVQDIKPITSSKCAPCHFPPTSPNFDWTDSAQLVSRGVKALDRITRDSAVAGKMPIKGAPNGPLTTRELSVLFGWLKRVAIPVTSVTVADTTVHLGDTLMPLLVWTPGDASNREFNVTDFDTAVVDTLPATIAGQKLITTGTGITTIKLQTNEGSKKLSFKVTVLPPLFQENALPIIKLKCAPCHVPRSEFNWQDSVLLEADGSEAIRRLERDTSLKGSMPQAGAPNGPLTQRELKILLAWLKTKVVQIKSVTVPDLKIPLGSLAVPSITYDPANASNKAYTLAHGSDTVVQIVGDSIRGRSLGTATVTATFFDGGLEKFFQVTVEPVKVDSVRVRDTAGTVSEAVRPVPLFFPANATNQGFTLNLTGASAILKIDSGKIITGLAVGKDTVEVVSTDGLKKDSLAFTVGPIVPTAIAAADTNGSGTQVVPVRVTFTPANTTNRAYTLSIPPADTGIAQVKGDSIRCKTTLGTIAAVTVTSVANPSIKTTFKFTVGPVKVDSIKMAQAKSYLAIGSKVSPKITFFPFNATDQTYTLTMAAANTANLTANVDGSITGVHLDSAIVTVKSTDGSKTAAWTVVSTRPVMGSIVVGGTVREIIWRRCSECHKSGVTSPPNWQDSVIVVSPTKSNPPATPPASTNPEKIISRVSVAKDMPPSYATDKTPLTSLEIKTLVDWLGIK